MQDVSNATSRVQPHRRMCELMKGLVENASMYFPVPHLDEDEGGDEASHGVCEHPVQESHLPSQWEEADEGHVGLVGHHHTNLIPGAAETHARKPIEALYSAFLLLCLPLHHMRKAHRSSTSYEDTYTCIQNSLQAAA